MFIRLTRSFRKKALILGVVSLMFLFLFRKRGPVSGTLHGKKDSTWHLLPQWLHGSPAETVDPSSYIKIAGFCLYSATDVTPALKVLKSDDVTMRLNSDGERTCCDVSVTEIYCEKQLCEISLFGKSYDFPSPATAALYKALRTAYITGTDYFLLCRNCTTLPKNWAEKYVRTLNNINPRNLGMGVPANGNYLFFHRTHIEVFGYVYPWRLPIPDTLPFLYNVYPSQNRIWLDVSGTHTELQGVKLSPNVKRIIREHRPVLSRYVIAKDIVEVPDRSTEVKVISMCLYGSSNRHVQGAIRNAQLAPIIFPGWTLRFYVPHPDIPGKNLQVQPETLDMLKRLGAQVKYIDKDVHASVAPMMWRFLVVDDPKVDIFVIQNSDSRLSPRLAAGINNWLETNTTFYCMRDHPWHAFSPISSGMWGARRQRLQDIMSGQFVQEMAKYNSSNMQDMVFLSRSIWTKVKNQIYCHDSVSCDSWMNAYPWPVPRKGLEHVGEVFNEFHVPLESNKIKLYNSTQNFKCEPERRNYFPPSD